MVMRFKNLNNKKANFVWNSILKQCDSRFDIINILEERNYYFLSSFFRKTFFIYFISGLKKRPDFFMVVYY